MYPRSGFRSGGTSAETTLLETTLLSTPKRGHWEIRGRFPKGWFWRTYPRSGFRSGGTSAKTTLLETTLLRTPDVSWCTDVCLRVRCRRRAEVCACARVRAEHSIIVSE